jgi:hypothetical protein
MTIDDLARAAASDARRTALGTVDPDLMLDRLHHQRRRQNAVSAVAAAVACALVLAVGVGLLTHHRAENQVSAPVVTPTPTPTGDDPCTDPAVTCLGSDRFRVALPAPMTLTMPADFGEISHIATTTAEAYRNDIDTTGVTVMENARAVKNDASWSRDPAAGKTATSMAAWLSKRPFLVGANVAPTTVGGRKAWRVSGQLKPGAALRADKGGEGPVAPTFGNKDNIEMGYNDELVGDYTLVDVPHGGVTVIWSWTVGHARDELEGNEPFVDSLSFG